MKITKYGHACILVEMKDVSILCDPGLWNPMPTPAALDAILITHEHQDHFDIEQVKALVAKFPKAQIITHAEIGAKLKEAGIAYTAIEPGQTIDVRGIPIESCGTEHAVVYGTSPCRNTGFFINNELFVTGDAVHDVPSKSVRVLALPTSGPWMKIAEAIDYAKKIQPKIVFPVHDALYIEVVRGAMVQRLLGMNLPGVEVVDLAPGASREF